MVTQDRHYSLSSLGVCAVLAVLLVALWDAGRRRPLIRALAVFAFLGLVVGEYKQVAYRNGRWAQVTGNYRRLLDRVEQDMDWASGMSVCAIQEPVRSRPYIMHGLRMDRPKWRVLQVGSEEEATRHRPCVYIRVEGKGRFVSVETKPIP
jgi:hypothetical protein